MKTLGKYVILEEINAGGMGRIYRARDRVLQREVVVKTIYTGSADPEIKHRFYREARACATLNHPNIVTVFDLGEQKGDAYIAMELLEGEDLQRFIDRSGSMNLDAKVNFMTEVCDGLGNAHRLGIVHRDIKPGNIFITRNGRPKLLDFGVARIAASQITQPGIALGTPRYMAPEQYSGKDCTAISDIFSIAMVFFEFLTHTHPFVGPPSTRWISKDVPTRIVKEEPLRLLDLNPDLPTRLGKVLSRAMAKKPEERYSGAFELAVELKKVSFELVRDCSRLLTEMMDVRKRILDYSSRLGSLLQKPTVRRALKEQNIDLREMEQINPDLSTTAVSQMQYSDVVALHDKIVRIDNNLTRILDEARASGLKKMMKSLSGIVSMGRKAKKFRQLGL